MERGAHLKARHNLIVIVWALLFLVCGTVGCAIYPDPSTKPEPTVVQIPPIDAGSTTADAGTDEMSLWQEQNELISLFSDFKARRVGDIVTIKVAETSSATNSANTETGRDSTLAASIQAFFKAKPSTLANLEAEGGMNSDFKGSGTTSRTGDLDAYITARVVEVLPNGNLKIIGSREILVNSEKQLLTIYGIVRPRDISDQNIVMSTYVADARIAYSGSGVVDDRQRPGWMANILNTIWPF